MKKLLKHPLVFVALGMLSVPAFSGGFVGFGVGQTEYSDDVDDATSFELAGGYRFNDFVALQLSYIDLGEVDSQNLGGDFSFSVDGLNTSVIGYLPVAETVEIYAKLGYLSWESTASFDSGSIGVSSTDEGTDLNYGFGVSWGVADNVKVNLGYDVYDFEEKANNVNLGLKYSF